MSTNPDESMLDETKEEYSDEEDDSDFSDSSDDDEGESDTVSGIMIRVRMLHLILDLVD